MFRMIFILMLVSLTGLATAQNPVKNPVTIETATIVVQADGSLALEVTGYEPDGCELPILVEQQQDEQTIFVEIYREIDPAMTCLMVLRAYEATIPLEGDFSAEGEYTVDVNGTVTTFAWIQGEAISPETPQAENRIPIQLYGARLLSLPEESLLMVTGVQDNCNDPLLVEQDLVDDTLYVFIGREVDPKRVCTSIMSVYDEILPIQDTPRTIEINGVWRFEIPRSDDQMRVPHVIESVDALLLESFPVQIHLQVTGYQPDGCDFPVQIEQRREDNTIYVDIFREMPADTMCTMMIQSYEATIPLEGGFPSGTYRINVNGVEVEVKI